MDIYELLRQEARSKKEGEPTKEQYGRVEIDLDTAREDEALHISGNQITIAFCDGTSTTTYFKLNHRHSRKIYPTEITKVEGNFGGLYLTNAAESGKKLTLYIARDIFIFPARAAANRILKENGTTIDPVEDKRFQSHALGQIDRKAQETINEDTPVSGTVATPVSLKVKWAIITVDTADTMFGTKDVTNKAGAHAGALVSNGATLTVEHCDLKDLYFVNEDGATKPYIAVIYTEEA